MNALQLSATLLVHTFLFLFLCVAFGWQSWKCVALYRLGDTSIKMVVVNAVNTRFPTVMINPGFKPDVLAQHGLTQQEYLNGDWSEKNIRVKPDDLYRQVTSDLEDVLESLTVVYHDGRVVEENPHSPLLTKTEKSGVQGEAYLFLYADLSTPEAMGLGHGVSEMFFKFKNKTDFEALTISVQHPGRLFAPEISLSTFKLNSGVRNVMTVRDSIIYLLDKDEYHCVPFPADEKVFYDDCLDNYVKEELKKEVNCRVPWVKDPSLPVCTSTQHKRASEIFFKAQENPPCLQPCCTMEIDVVNKFNKVNEDGSTIMELKFPPTIKFHQEIEVYSFVSMLAEVAGYLGMFLGVSFFDMRFLMDMTMDYMKKNNINPPMAQSLKPNFGIEVPMTG